MQYRRQLWKEIHSLCYLNLMRYVTEHSISTSCATEASHDKVKLCYLNSVFRITGCDLNSVFQWY